MLLSNNVDISGLTIRQNLITYLCLLKSKNSFNTSAGNSKNNQNIYNFKSSSLNRFHEYILFLNFINYLYFLNSNLSLFVNIESSCLTQSTYFRLTHNINVVLNLFSFLCTPY